MRHEHLQEVDGDGSPLSSADTPRYTWTRHGAFSCRQGKASKGDCVPFSHSEGGEMMATGAWRYTPHEDAAGQAAATTASQFHVRLQQLEAANQLRQSPGAGSTWVFAPELLDSPQGFPFQSRIFFIAQLSLLDPFKEELGYICQQEEALKALSQESEQPRFILCLDGEGGETCPKVEYIRRDGQALGDWVAHMYWRVESDSVPMLDHNAGLYCDTRGPLQLKVASCMFNVALGSYRFGRNSTHQAELNRRGLEDLVLHVKACCQYLRSKQDISGFHCTTSHGDVDFCTPVHLESTLDNIRKMVDELVVSQQLLLVVDQLCKDIGGATRLNCKSGKDRTQLLASVLKAKSFGTMTAQKPACGVVDYSIARELMWGSGLQVAYRNTGKPRFKLSPCALVKNLYSQGTCCCWLRGLCFGIKQYMSSHNISK